MRSAAFVLILLHFALARRHHHLQEEADPAKLAEDDALSPVGKLSSGKLVCISKNSTYPMKNRQVYCKPVYKKYVQRCHGNQLCTVAKVVYEQYFKESDKPNHHFHCCTGWPQINKKPGCNKVVCTTPCKNGGTCIKSDICVCPKGFVGRFCEVDVDECKEQKPCDQICHNTHGSFYCQCRENFVLKDDGQSCKKEDEDGTALEAKDLELDLMDRRLVKLETMINEIHKNDTSKHEITSLNYKMDEISRNLNSFDSRIKNLEYLKRDTFRTVFRLSELEKKLSKVDELSYKFEKIKKCVFLNKLLCI